MKSGIYSITQLSTGLRYVGSAVNLRQRFARHKQDLRAQRHHNQKLQRSWNKYGESDFLFGEIEKCEESRLVEREQFWMNEIKPYFNILRTAYSARGYRHDEAAKEKMSAASLRFWRGITKEQREKRGRQQSEIATGLKHTEETRRKMSEAHKLIAPHQNSLRNLTESRSSDPDYYLKAADAGAKTIYVVTAPDGCRREVRNLSAFCRENGLSQSHLVAAAMGKKFGYKGWRCAYRDNPVAYNDRRKPRYEVDGKMLTVAEISKLYGMHKNTAAYRINKMGIEVFLLRATPSGDVMQQ